MKTSAFSIHLLPELQKAMKTWDWMLKFLKVQSRPEAPGANLDQVCKAAGTADRHVLGCSYFLEKNRCVWRSELGEPCYLKENKCVWSLELGKPSFPKGKWMFLKPRAWKTFIFERKTNVFEAWKLRKPSFSKGKQMCLKPGAWKTSVS